MLNNHKNNLVVASQLTKKVHQKFPVMRHAV